MALTKAKKSNIEQGAFSKIEDNIALLGFKMAVNEGLTVFNLQDGIVDEFEDQSGVDTSGSTNLRYSSANDYYINHGAADGVDLADADQYIRFDGGDNFSAPNSNPSSPSYWNVSNPGSPNNAQSPNAGFSKFTIPPGVDQMEVYLWGAGGGADADDGQSRGGAGGFVWGNINVNEGDVFTHMHGGGGEGAGTAAGEGGRGSASHPNRPTGDTRAGGSGNGQTEVGGGGGMSFLFQGDQTAISNKNLAPVHTQAVLIAGGGGGSSNQSTPASPGASLGSGGGGGGLTGLAGGTGVAQTENSRITGPSPSPTNPNGGGGSQTAGGEGGVGPQTAQSGGRFYGGDGSGPGNGGAGGGAGYFGGGGSANYPTGGQGAGGGGSSYYGNPIVANSYTAAAAPKGSPDPVPLHGDAKNMTSPGFGATGTPEYAPNLPGSRSNFAPVVDNQMRVSASNMGYGGAAKYEPGYGAHPGQLPTDGQPGNGLIIMRRLAETESMTIISDDFTASSEPTTARIVVFQEDVETTTLNTNIVASISRDGGTTYTDVTLEDAGYVTGSSGQRILTGSATISGQPTGTTMKYKIASSTNTHKIHGVSLQWST